MKYLTFLKILLYIFILSFIILLYQITKSNFGSFLDFKSQIKKEKAKLNIENFVLDQTNKDELEWRLASDVARVYENKNLIKLELVELKIYKDDKVNYIINSDLGIYEIENKLFKLSENVKIKTISGYKFNTQKLEYDIDSKNIKSNEVVNVSNENNDVTFMGKGLKGNSQEMVFSLLDDVNAISKNDELNIKSTRVYFYTKSNYVQFQDNVRAKKKDMNVFCSKLNVYYNDEGFKDMQGLGSVNIIFDSNKKAYAKKVEFKNEYIKLMGDAVMLLNEDEYKGEIIKFYTSTNNIEVIKASGKVKGIDIK